MRSTRPAPLILALVLATAAPRALAQDGDATSAMLRQQEELRAKQLSQVNGAFGRASAPIDEMADAARAQRAAREAEKRAEEDADRREPPTRWGPWVLGGLALLAGAAFVKVFRSAR